MNIRLFSVAMLIIFSSCQVYNSEFDCPPCRGVPCTSVSDIQKMIVETPEGGPDIFLAKPLNSCSNSRPRYHGSERKRNKGIERQRIWVEHSESETATVQGHFIYFDQKGEGEF